MTQLRQEVAGLRQDVACLHRENLELRQRAGYWEAQHARSVERERLLQAQVEQLQADNRELRSQLFGQRSEKTSTTDRSNPAIPGEGNFGLKRLFLSEDCRKLAITSPDANSRI